MMSSSVLCSRHLIASENIEIQGKVYNFFELNSQSWIDEFVVKLDKGKWFVGRALDN